MSHASLGVDDGVLTLTFTRDEKRNAISAEMLDMLATSLDRLEADPAARVLVITAEGREFTAGMDIGAIDLDAVGMAAGSIDGVAFRSHYRAMHDLFDRMERIEKPVIAGVQGPCRGLGVEFGVSCDFRICATRASFSLPELAHLAVMPGSGGVSRLTRLVGPHWARWMVMAGRPVDAEAALGIGLVHQVVADDRLRAEVDHLARHLASLSPQALGLAKLAIDAAATVDRATARDVDRIANTVLIASTEHRRRIEAFNTDGATPPEST